MPSTKSVVKNLIAELKLLEKQGVKISRDDIIKLFQDIAEEGVDLYNINQYNIWGKRHLIAMEDLYSRLFFNLASIAENIPQKDGESISAFVSRVAKPVIEEFNKWMLSE